MNEGNYYVYKLKFSDTDKTYIGQTKNLENRFSSHKRALEGGYHVNSDMQNYFSNNPCIISMDVIEVLENKICADSLEEKLIEENYELIFNISKNSGGGDILTYHPNLDKIKEKLRYSNLKARQEGRLITEPKFGKDNPNYKHGERSREFTLKLLCKTCLVEPVKSNEASCKNCWTAKHKETFKGEANPFFNKEHSEEVKTTISNKFKEREKMGLTNSKAVIVDGVEYCSFSEAGRCLGIGKELVRSRTKSKKFSNYVLKEKV